MNKPGRKQLPVLPGTVSPTFSRQITCSDANASTTSSCTQSFLSPRRTFHILSPPIHPTNKPVAVHLAETLRLFQKALAQPITTRNADALIATSALLVHHAWATTDTFHPPSAPHGRQDAAWGWTSAWTLYFSLARPSPNFQDHVQSHHVG